MSKPLNPIKSILLIDDDSVALELYAQLIREKTGATVVPTKFPNHGLRIAEDHFFDIVLVDVTMHFRGTPFGGLEVYKSLRARYGDSSLVAYSQFITDELLKEYEYDFNFLEKGSSSLKFIDKLVDLMLQLRKRQTCFVAMPFDRKYAAIFSIISACVRSSGYEPWRVDERQFTDSIVKRIFQGIQSCKFVVFVATDMNPNAFYECGYAVALNKEVLTLTDRYENLPFDIRDRHAISYASGLKKAAALLSEQVTSMTRVADADYILAE